MQDFISPFFKRSKQIHIAHSIKNMPIFLFLLQIFHCKPLSINMLSKLFDKTH